MSILHDTWDVLKNYIEQGRMGGGAGGLQVSEKGSQEPACCGAGGEGRSDPL